MVELPPHLGDKEVRSFLGSSSSCILHSLPCPQTECIDVPEKSKSGFKKQNYDLVECIRHIFVKSFFILAWASEFLNF